MNQVAAKTPTQKYICIQTKNSGCFISDNITGQSYNYGAISIGSLLFDGQKVTPTKVNHWWKLDKTPSKVERVSAARQLIKGYKLKLGYAPSEKMPSEVTPDFFAEDEDDDNSHLKTFYDVISESIPQENEIIPFELHVIAERDTWEPIRTDFQVQYGLMDQLTIADPVLLIERPCRLNREESYKIIREYIKNNLNGNVARITSDYDFCLSVSKVIPLVKPQPYQRNVARFGARKPKWTTDYLHSRNVTVFECAPKPYQNYTLCEEFTGSSYQDLQENIKSYLEDVMKEINKPLCDCPHCEGKGVIVNKK